MIRAKLVVRWVTTCEALVLNVFFLCALLFFFFHCCLLPPLRSFPFLPGCFMHTTFVLCRLGDAYYARLPRVGRTTAVAGYHPAACRSQTPRSARPFMHMTPAHRSRSLSGWLAGRLVARLAGWLLCFHSLPRSATHRPTQPRSVPHRPIASSPPAACPACVIPESKQANTLGNA